MNIMTPEEFEEEYMTEAFSNVSFMDVSELRMLYYGRLNMYVSFTDTWELDTSGFIEGELERPYGVQAYPVDIVVGKKVSSPLFYGFVMRHKGGDGFINDIATYSYDDYRKDVEVIEALDYLNTGRTISILSEVESDPMYRSYFHRFWDLTKKLSAHNRYADKLWRRILLDLGYKGFNDPKGKGILSSTHKPVAVIIDLDGIEKYDIVPIQKYRKDKRRYVTDRVDRENRRMWVARNRVAKKRTDRFRGAKKRDKGLITKQDIENLKTLGGF